MHLRCIHTILPLTIGCHRMSGDLPPSPPHYPVFGMENIANAIAYEIKLEMANRYFGYRTRMENQSKEYLIRLQESGRELETTVRLDLCRMQYLLQEPRLFCSFVNLVGLPRDYALNLCSRQSFSQVQELFMTMRGEGFTRWRRFRRLAIIVYHSLADAIATYQNMYLLLQDEHAEICREIEKFQRHNDLSEILCFLRDLDSPDSERMKFLHSQVSLQSSNSFEHDLRLALPPPVTESMVLLNLLPPFNQIKGQFTELLKQAFARHDCSGLSFIPF
jgi:hypothetical protein